MEVEEADLKEFEYIDDSDELAIAEMFGLKPAKRFFAILGPNTTDMEVQIATIDSSSTGPAPIPAKV